MPKEIAMFLDSYSNLIFVARQRRLQDLPTERGQCTPGAERPPCYQRVSPADRAIRARARHIVTVAKEVVGTMLSWVANLPCDSRERLRSKEYELAMLGISWATDPVHDAVLAREIEVARQRRRAANERRARRRCRGSPGPAFTGRPGRPSNLNRRAARGRHAGACAPTRRRRTTVHAAPALPLPLLSANMCQACRGEACSTALVLAGLTVTTLGVGWYIPVTTEA